MPELKKILKDRLKDAKKVAVLGIGSTLRSDDAAGLLVAEELKKSSSSKLKGFFGGTAPENLTGEILKYKPSHIIIIDSVDAGQKPGSILLVSPEEADGVSFSSHMLPVKMMVDYLLESLDCQIIILGIQPGKLSFDGDVSKEITESARQISDAVLQALL